MKMVHVMAFFAAAAIITGCSANRNTTHATGPIPDSTMVWLNQNKRSVVMESYASFVKHMKPALDKMAGYKIVGLGEGTHGTSEFQTIRAYITRYLAEEKGFNIICLENSYGACVTLNRHLQSGEGNLDTAMHRHLLGMWQNEEMKALLQWATAYNQTHTGNIQLTGMDYSSIEANGAIIQQVTGSLHHPGIDSIAAKLAVCCRYMDEAYADFNRISRKFVWNDIVQNGKQGYEMTQKLKQELNTLPGDIKEKIPQDQWILLNTAIYNCEIPFGGFSVRKETSRDEVMANMIKLIADNHPGAKIIVWAHNVHLARKQIFNDGNGGGTGSFIESLFPHQYFVLATGTAGGTVSTTSDRFIVNTSRFTSHSLPAAIDGSWEQTMVKLDAGNMYFDLTNSSSTLLPELTLRCTGYRQADKKDFVKVQLRNLFDGFMFIKTTRATTVKQH